MLVNVDCIYLLGRFDGIRSPKVVNWMHCEEYRCERGIDVEVLKRSTFALGTNRSINSLWYKENKYLLFCNDFGTSEYLEYQPMDESATEDRKIQDIVRVMEHFRYCPWNSREPRSDK